MVSLDLSQANHRLTDGIVHSLIYCWPHPTPLFASNDYLCDLEGRVVAQTQLYEFPLFVHLIDLLKSLREGHGPVRCMQVEDIYTVGPQFLQRSFQTLPELVRLVRSWLFWITFGGKL